MYPENGEGGAPGQTAAFNFDANGDADVAEFKYRLDGQAEKSVKAVNEATAYITRRRAIRTRFTWSSGPAGNRAPENKTRNYVFRVGVPNPPAAQWKMDGRSPSTTVLNAVNPAHDGSFSAGKAKVVVAGSVTRWISTAVPTRGCRQRRSHVNTAESFTVSAWVRLDRSINGRGPRSVRTAPSFPDSR